MAQGGWAHRWAGAQVARGISGAKTEKNTRSIVFGGTVACWAGTRVAMLNKWTSGLEIHTLAECALFALVQCFALIALLHCAPRARVATQSK